MLETDTKKWSGILVYLECYNGKLHPSSEELIGEAVRLAETSGDAIYATGIGQKMEQIQEMLEGYPVKKVYLYEAKDEYESSLYTEIMTQCIETIKPAIVLVGGTYEGRSLAPGLAVQGFEPDSRQTVQDLQSMKRETLCSQDRLLVEILWRIS